MDLKQINELQDRIEDFNETLLDIKELLIEKKQAPAEMYSYLRYKTHALIVEIDNVLL